MAPLAGPIPFPLAAPMVRALLAGWKTQARIPLRVQPVSVEYHLHGTVSDHRQGLPTMRDAAGRGWATCGDFTCPFIPRGMCALESGRLANSRTDDQTKRRALLWVREPATVIATSDGRNSAWNVINRAGAQCIRVRYAADDRESDWIPYPARLRRVTVGHALPGGCFREAARLLLCVTAVRCERLHDLTEEDAIAEGMTPIRRAKRGGRGEGPWAAPDVPLRDCYGPLVNTHVHGSAKGAFECYWDWTHGPRRALVSAWEANPYVWVITFRRVRAQSRLLAMAS